MVRFCLDLSPAVHHHAGLGRYAQELLLALAAADEKLEHFPRSSYLKGMWNGFTVSNNCGFNLQHM